MAFTHPGSRGLRTYLLLSGLAAHAAAAAVLLAWMLLFPDHGLGDLLHKAKQRFGDSHPTATALIDATIRVTGLQPASRAAKRTVTLPDFPGPDEWPAQGPQAEGFTRVPYDELGIPQQAAQGPFLLGPDDELVPVRDAKGLLNALKRAKPGQIITLAPGTYHVRRRAIGLGSAGLPGRPIVVRAEHPGDVRIELDTLEGFYVDRPYWVFENLSIHGACGNDSRCEHAFHVVGDAVGTVLRNNELVDFNAPLKVNGLFDAEGDRFPDFGLVHNNNVYNTRVRKTGNPVTLLNINAGNGWVVSANFIADFAKGQSNRISYAAFMKSNSSDGVFERNLVVCHWRLPPEGGVRVGLSFGGGGSGANISRQRSNRTEHTAGIMRNNIIARCPLDVGIYLNKAARTQIYNNALIGTTGIDVRFATSTASIHNNILDGRIADRDGGHHSADNNLGARSCSWFARVFGGCSSADYYQAPLSGDLRVTAVERVIDQGNNDPRRELDFCGNPRHAPTDIGPIEYGAGPLCLPTL